MATKEGKGVVVVDGKLIENLHVENAKRLVALFEAIEAADMTVLTQGPGHNEIRHCNSDVRDTHSQ